MRGRSGGARPSAAPGDAGRRGPHPAAALAARALFAVALSALAAYAVLWAVTAVAEIRFPYELDYGEGPILNQVRLLLAGSSPYRGHGAPPYIVANYPPVYLAAVALLHILERGLAGLPGAGPGAGRALSAAATLAAALLFGGTVGRLQRGDGTRGPAPSGRARGFLAGALAAALVLAQPYVWRWGTLQRVDPLALAWSAAGLFAVARAPYRARRAWPWFLLAALTRQDAVEGLAAALWYLWPDHRREARVLLLRWALGLGAATAALEAATRGQFLGNIVADNVNAWGLGRLGAAAGDWLQAGGLPLLAFAAWGWRLSRTLPDQGGRLLRGYLAAAAAVALTAGKVGSSVNYLLPTIGATAMLASLVVRTPGRALTAAGLLAAYAVGIPPLADRPGAAGTVERALSAYRDLGTPGFGALGPTPRSVLDPSDPSQAQLVALLRRTPGPILSENMTALVLAGHRIFFQPFEMTQLAEGGRWNDGPVVAMADAGAFPLVVVQFPLSNTSAWDLQRWPANLLAAVAGRYALVRRLGPYSIYAPRGGGAGAV